MSCCAACQAAGMAGAPEDYAAAVERVRRVLLDYIAQLVASGQPWYISAELNSDTVSASDLQGLGFWQAIAAAVTSVASKVVAVAPKIANAAGTYASIKSMTGSTQAKLQAQGINLPPQVVQNSLLDAFGPQNRSLVFAAIGLGLVLLLTRKKS